MWTTIGIAWTFAWLVAPQAGPRTSGHASARVGRDVYTFGGLLGSAGSEVMDELWTRPAHPFGEWNRIDRPDSGAWPAPRMYAAVAATEGAFYLCGGWDPEEPGSGGAFKSDVWRFSVPEREWTRLADLPSAVSRHCACALGDGSVVIQTFRETCVLSDGAVRSQPTTGEAPVGLSMSTIVTLSEDRVVLFGGTTRTQEMFADVFALNTTTWEWSKLRSMGDAPGPRASACAAPVGKNRFAIFGGGAIGAAGYQRGKGLRGLNESYVCDVEGSIARWKRVGADSSEAPLPRVGASMTEVDGTVVMVQGGWDPNTKRTYDDTWFGSMA